MEETVATLKPKATLNKYLTERRHREILSSIDEGDVSLSTIAERTNIAELDVLSLLLEMTSAGLVESTDAGPNGPKEATFKLSPDVAESVMLSQFSDR